MVKIYEGLEPMAEVPLERSAYAFSIRLAADTLLELKALCIAFGTAIGVFW